MDPRLTSAVSVRDLAALIDHTLLKPDASSSEVAHYCEEARQQGFHAVVVHGSCVSQTRQILEDTGIKVATVVGFPLGAMESDVKRYETEAAVDNGAEEIDMVLNLGWLLEGKDKAIFRELRDVVEAADERIVKVILETGYLQREHIVRACRLAVESGAHFVKTSTGFGPRGASVEDVALMRETVGPKFGVKAAGGIRDLPTALAMIKAGANRLGTSRAMDIVRQAGGVPG
jgi:deoxyribose-phosphate aldolase